MVTVKIDERTREGKALLDFLKTYSTRSKGIEIEDYPVSKNVPNAETLEIFEENDRQGTEVLKKFKNAEELFEDMGI